MRTITIHPLSLAAGTLLAGVAFITMSQSSLQAPMPLRVEYIPHPHDYFRIEEGAPYAVPTGRILVLAGIGTRSTGTGAGPVNISVNGTTVDYLTNPGGGNYLEAPRGLTYGAGTTLQVIDNTTATQESYAVSYLVFQ